MSLPPVWQAALQRMFSRRQNPLYMPAVLLSVVKLFDHGVIWNGVVHFDAVEPVFDALGGEALAGRAWQPFFHLSRSAKLWTLYLGKRQASFADLTAGRPKSRGVLLSHADRARISDAYLPCLLDPDGRRAIAWAILEQLLLDGDDLPQQLTRLSGFRIGRVYRFRSPPQYAADSHTRTYRSAPTQQASQQHHALQDELARLLLHHRLEPLEPMSCDPAFDLAWEAEGRLHVAEVKSLHDGNESEQLRRGLGQVLEYRHLLARRSVVQPRALLLVERRPTRLHWPDVCEDVGVELLWPDRMARLVRAAGGT